jgi:integrase
MKHRKSGVQIRVIHRKTRGTFVLRWRDPVTDRPCEVTAEGKRRRDAFNEAADLARKIDDGEFIGDIEWADFCRRYEEEKLPLASRQTEAAWGVASRSMAKFKEPVSLRVVNGDYLSQWTAWLKERGLSTATIASYLRRLRAALGWAATTWKGYRPPKIILPRIPTSTRMKGRPITAEEFDRMIAAAPKIVGAANAKSWRRFLRGLWLLGRRLDQTLNLHWDRTDMPHVIDLDGISPKLRIPPEWEKGKREQLTPLMPDAVVFLRRWPPERRRGRVFRPRLERGPIQHVVTASATITAIGEKARVQVARKMTKDPKTGTPVQKIKWASAHDLRRSFGTRWAPKLKPLVLKLIMGHKSLETTQQYYVDLDVDDMAKDIWRDFGGQSGDLGQKKHDQNRQGGLT